MLLFECDAVPALQITTFSLEYQRHKKTGLRKRCNRNRSAKNSPESKFLSTSVHLKPKLMSRSIFYYLFYYSKRRRRHLE
ncbi:unnamed protein product [Haemonchus placei]|uniref:Uncharacterized protein n=1 Tax=Haemonchus placei TaxID=6290 RepID=A0A3P7WU73_HAEPC|nr:unnamed protein product [Haemonchus placei]